MTFPLCQQPDDAPSLLLVEERHDAVQLSVLHRLRTTRGLLASFALAGMYGRFHHAPFDHAWIPGSSDQVNEVQPLNYGKALEKAGQLDRARSVLEDALSIIPVRIRDVHPLVPVIHSMLSDLDYTQGRLDQAVEHARASLEIYQRTMTSDHVRVAEAYTNLANVELKRRRFVEALALYQSALALRRRYLGDDNYQVAITEVAIAETLVDLARPAEAMPHLIEAENTQSRGSARERTTEAWLLTVRGEVLFGMGRSGAAVPVLERALSLSDDNDPDPTNRGLALWTLARALQALGEERERVVMLAERAPAIFVKLGAVEVYDRDAVARFLERLVGQSSSRPQSQ